MKLFQQLLVAPAALGLMAPMAVNAAELNINGVSDYSANSAEVQSFSDVHPTDWAFKALSSLAERHGCAVATPNASMTRYEAAALLNKCLGNVAEVTEDERRLINEFGPELAVIKGRVDGLESRVSEFEAGAFSSTTTMSGKAAFITGYVDNDDAAEDSDAITMEYMYQLNMNTSFTGDDLLYTRIKTGNVSDHFGDKGQGTYLSAANGNGDVLEVDKIWYQFPLGDSTTVWVGPKIENYYMLASAPSIYKPITKQFSLGGNGTVYGSSTQPGFGVAWTQQKEDPTAARWEVSAAYTNQKGADSGDDDHDKDYGLFGEDGESALLTKVGYGAPRWQVSLAAAFKDNGWQDSYFTTEAGKVRHDDSSETAFGLRAYWKPEEAGAVPAVQVGYDVSNIDDAGLGNADETDGWMIGLGWSDLFMDGNTGGVAFGSRISASSIVGGGDDAGDDNTVWEAYYSFKVNDGVTVTPAIFGGEDVYNGTEEISGAVVLTEFRF